MSRLRAITRLRERRAELVREHRFKLANLDTLIMSMELREARMRLRLRVMRTERGINRIFRECVGDLNCLEGRVNMRLTDLALGVRRRLRRINERS